MHKLTLICVLLQSLFIFQAVNCTQNGSQQKSVETVSKPGLATNLFNGGLSIAKKFVDFTAVQIKGCIYAGRAINNAIQCYKETHNITLAAQKSAADLKGAIDIFMGIPGVKLSVTVLSDFKNKESWGTIFMNGGRETIDILPFGKRARLKAMATIQAVKDFNEAFQEALADQPTVKKGEVKPDVSKTKPEEEPVINLAVQESSSKDGKENSDSIEDRELMMAMTGLGTIQALQEGKTISEVVAEGVEGKLMKNAYRHPSVLDLIAFYDKKGKKTDSPQKQAPKTRSSKLGN